MRTRHQPPGQGQTQCRLRACDQGRPSSLEQPSPVRGTWAEGTLPRGWGDTGSRLALNQMKKSRDATTALAKNTPSWLRPCLGQSHILEGKPRCPLLIRKAPDVQKRAARRLPGQQALASTAPLIPAVFLEGASKAATFSGAPLLGNRSPRPPTHTASWKQSCWGDWGISGHSRGVGPGRGGP